MYSEQELKSWVEKVNEIREQTKILRIYFNNHYGGKAVVNAMQFKEMTMEYRYQQMKKEHTSLVIRNYNRPMVVKKEAPFTPY